MVPSEAWYQVTTNFDSQSEKETNHITVKSTMSSTCWSRLMGFLSVNVGSLSNLDRCRHPCASRPRESDSRYSWGSSWGFDNFIHDCLCVCVWCFFSSKSKVAKLFGCFYPQRSTWLLKSDGKQQAKSEPRHFKTCPKTLCATPCNSPETLLRESTTKRRGWFHLPSHFEHHQSSHFASNLLQKSYRKLRGRIKNLNEKAFSFNASNHGSWRWPLSETQPKNQKHVDVSRSWSAWALARTTEKTSSVSHQAGAWRLYPCDIRRLNFLNQEIQVFTARSWSQSKDKNSQSR